MTKYKVIYSIDSLDTEPDVELFDNEQEAVDWLREEANRRVESHLYYTGIIKNKTNQNSYEKQYKDLFETEMSLARIEEGAQNGIS